MIRKLCYELYKIDWKHSHMITRNREMDVTKEYFKEVFQFGTFESFNEYLNKNGYQGELYVCFEEFLGAEYREKEYICELLTDDALTALYLADLEGKNDEPVALEKLREEWTMSAYNEDKEDRLEYFIDESKCEPGDKAYLYSFEEDTLSEMEVVRIIRRDEDPLVYDTLIESEREILIDGEVEYEADTSAEFITDDTCYLVWFKYI